MRYIDELTPRELEILALRRRHAHTLLPHRPLKRRLDFCTPCGMEREHYAAEGYWNCHACGNSICPVKDEQS